jgi:NADH-quinone oxidoreductase subunit M
MSMLLSLLTFVPLVGATLILFVPPRTVRPLALLTSAVSFSLVVVVLSQFDSGAAAMQLVQRVPWIPSIHVEYIVGVDGISILLLLLTALVVPLAIVASWSVTRNIRTYFFLVLVLQTGMFGVFLALSFFHWFIFWELVLVPGYFLIKMFGGARAHAAALKFFLYTLVGSVAMLLSFVVLYLATDTFDFMTLARLGQSGELAFKLRDTATGAGLDWSATTCSMVAFGGIALACAVKTPMWPLHTWLPDAYAEAPTPTTMMLTAVLSKMGVYGLLRLALPIFPDAAAAAAPILLPLAVLTVVAAAFTAFSQTDLKRMIAYSSVNHVGYCLVGIFAAVAASGGRADDRAAVLNGVVLQMFNHGVTASALFFLLGALEQRTNMRGLDDFGGLRAVMPKFGLVFGIVLFSSLGLPGLNGFVGEFLILKGAFALAPLMAATATLGIVVTALFLLTVMQRVWWGPVRERWSRLPDLSWPELLASAIFVSFIFGAGVLPGPFVRLSNATVRTLIEVIQR